MTVLAISRPYEGMVLGVLTSAVLVWSMARHPSASLSPAFFKTIVLPLLLVLAIAFGAIAFYNLRVTGTSLRLPYQVHEATYAVTPLFLWQRPRTIPNYRHEVLREFHVDLATRVYRAQNTLCTWLASTRYKYSDLLNLHFPASFRYVVLPLVILTIPFALKKDPWMRIVLLILAGFILGTLPEVFMSYRYTAPAISLLFLFVLQSMHHLNRWTWGPMPIGRSLVRVCLLTCVMAFVLTNARWIMYPEEMALNRWGMNRARILSELKRDGGRHLVIARYGSRHSPDHEWVYNAADIDNAPVVWAREMDPASDGRLLRYFDDRRVWLLSIDNDADPPRLAPYRPSP